MTGNENNSIDVKPTVSEFYAGRDIFITGGSGFMGKVLIEKLLRSCSSLNRMFILVRKKKDIPIEERLEQIIKLPLFDRVRKECPPDIFKKLIPINGDCSLIGMGLSEQDKCLMENISIIFHSAACVRFDDDFKSAILLNIRGTREVLEFGLQLKNLKVAVHVSTAYSNYEHEIVEEDIYPAKDDWRNTIKIAENYNLELLNSIMIPYTNNAPNTYVYTKAITENMVYEYSKRLPVIIYRPSVVLATLEEPMPGWVDNFNGPFGLLAGCGTGILRTSYGDPDIVSDTIPVDTAIKGIIVAVYDWGIKERMELQVYNCTASLQRRFTTGFVLEIGKHISEEYPLNYMVWKPGGCITRCKYYNFIKFLIAQLLYAYVIDFVIKLSGNKPILVRLQRKIYFANQSLKIFIFNSWTFKNDKFLKLQDTLKPSDCQDFAYDQFITSDLQDEMIRGAIGGRRYLLNYPDESLPKARALYKKMSLLDTFTKYIICSFLFYWAFYKLVFLIQFTASKFQNMFV